MAKNILLVDDDALLRRSLVFNLEQSGYSIRAAAKTEKAIAMAEQEAPELVLLDINLPGIDGLEALRILHKEKKLPVIILTARLCRWWTQLAIVTKSSRTRIA